MTKTLSKFLILFLFSLLITENSLSDKIIIPNKKPIYTTSLKEKFILPEKKPILSESVKLKIKQKSFLLPAKKPVAKSVEKPKDLVKEKEVAKEKIILTKEEDKIILPKNKPSVYKKQVEKVAQKSQYFSKKDFRLAKKIFSNVDKRKWDSALNLAKNSKDRSVYKLVKWLYLLEPNNQADFYDYINFINLNSNFPRLSRLRYLAEHKITTKLVNADRVIKFFSEQDPLSGYGKLILGYSHVEKGNDEKGKQLIKEGWITAKLSKRDLRYFKKKLKKYLNNEDHINRADWLAWENKYWDLKRMLRYLPKDYQALYNARQLLMSKSYGVDAAIAKVPNKFKKDHGLQYDRLKWRRKRGRVDSSLEILLEIKNDPNTKRINGQQGRRPAFKSYPMITVDNSFELCYYQAFLLHSVRRSNFPALF